MIRRYLSDRLKRAVDRWFPDYLDPDASPEEPRFGTSTRDWEAEREKLPVVPTTLEKRHATLRAVLAAIACGHPARELPAWVAQHHLELVQRCAELALQDDDREAARASG